MDSRPFSPEPGSADEYLTRFQEAARRGDWMGAGKIMAELRDASLPADGHELGEYLRRLQHALAIARASRAASAGTLSRLTAVANFNRAVPESQTKRQNLVGLTSY